MQSCHEFKRILTINKIAFLIPFSIMLSEISKLSEMSYVPYI